MYSASNTVYPRVVTGSAGTIEYGVFGTTHATGPSDIVAPLSQGTISTATTTTLYQPASGVEAQIRHIVVTNTHASVSNLITIMAYDGSTDRQLWKGTLEIGEALHWVERDGVWRMYTSDGFVKLVEATNSGDSFPSALYHGKPWYRTDLNWAFHYDSDRAKWLGELEIYQFGRNGNVTAESYLRYGGNVLANGGGSGHSPVHAVTIVGMVAQHDGSVTPSGDFVVWRNSTRLTGVVVTSPADGASDFDLNDNFAANGFLSVNWGDIDGVLSPTTIVDGVATVYMRRRET